MIVWLSSYPKSGNTWVRSFISSLIFTNNGDADFNAMQKISQYPRRSHFTSLLENLEDLNSLSENWIPSQKLINLDKKIISGDPEKIKKIYDTWVFSRDVTSANPNWQLVNTLT